MKSCRICSSHAINPHHHGRIPNVDLDLCDVCYWRKRAEQQAKELEALRGFAQSVQEYTASERTRLDLVRFGLCDNQWKPTKLLTGETE